MRPPRNPFLRLLPLFGLVLGAARPAFADPPPSSPGMVAVPLVKTTLNHFGIEAAINGHPLLLTIDTGAPLTTIDTRAYQQDVPVDSTQQVPEKIVRLKSLNNQAARTGWVQDLQAGSMHFGSGPVAVTDLSHVSGVQSSDYRVKRSLGLLGVDIMTKYGAIIDWERRVIYFFTNTSQRAPIIHAAVAGGWTAVPMAYTSGRHFAVPCNVGNAPHQLVIDTGGGYTMLDKVIWAPKDVTSGQPRMYMNGIGSILPVSPIVVKNWYIGKFLMKSTMTVVGDFQKDGLFNETAPGPGKIVGILGSEWLARTNAIIDVNGMTLYLKSS